MPSCWVRRADRAIKAVHQALESDALRQIPTSFVIREEVMESRYPRWGGDHELMADLAQQSQALVQENPYCTGCSASSTRMKVRRSGYMVSSASRLPH